MTELGLCSQLFPTLPHLLWGQGRDALEMQDGSATDNRNSRDHGFLKVVQSGAPNQTQTVLSLDLIVWVLLEVLKVTAQPWTGKDESQQQEARGGGLRGQRESL